MVQTVVVLANWNGRHLLESSLPAMMRQTCDDYQVVVVDNGSTDGSVGWVATHHPEVRVIALEGNLGFGEANNCAIRATESRYVATLNNDAVPDEGWLASLVQAAETGPEVGMCASKMVRDDSPGVMDSCGLEVDVAGIGWDRYSGQPERMDEDTPYQVFGPCAGAALYRRAMLDQVGSFDPAYFAYYEDVDLAWRAQRRGWRCLYVPAARVTHQHSSTAGEGSSFKGYHLGRNKVWTVVKNYPWPELLLCLPLIAAYDAAAWSYAALRGDLAPLRGRLAALGSLSGARQLRQEIQAQGRRVPLSAPRNPLAAWRTHLERLR